jgi:ADP-dependent NAD(P)H-hydrate dehydratase / NAD(P)H-hydrate epimerase
MKAVSPSQMAEIESQAYRAGASDAEFMQEAGSGVALVVHELVEKYDLERQALLLCGKGNNAGDTYVAGIDLLHLEYSVFALQMAPIETCSPLCRQNYENFIREGGQLVRNFDAYTGAGVIIDGIFGTGFRGKVSPEIATLIEQANNSGLPIVAVDIPSGLNGETGAVEGSAMIARETAFLGLPKTGFFLREGWNHVGQLRYVDFGLPEDLVESCPSELVMLTPDMLSPLFPRLKRNRHKYEAGYVVGLAGSPGMPGAAILSSAAALRGGAGIVRLLHPEGMQAELAAAPSELVRQAYHYPDIEPLAAAMNRASATFIGPGMGRTAEARALLLALLPRLQKPCVIDADALFLLGNEDKYALPENTLMTPHMGEMLHLLHLPPPAPALTLDFLKRCQQFAVEKNIILILKGAPTFILSRAPALFVNPTGDPGMATAGSGDVLTGLLGALLAQKIPPLSAAMLGVFLHGIAGEVAAEELTSYSMNASDLIFHFPEAFKFLTQVRNLV